MRNRASNTIASSLGNHTLHANTLSLGAGENVQPVNIYGSLGTAAKSSGGNGLNHMKPRSSRQQDAYPETLTPIMAAHTFVKEGFASSMDIIIKQLEGKETCICEKSSMQPTILVENACYATENIPSLLFSLRPRHRNASDSSSDALQDRRNGTSYPPDPYFAINMAGVACIRYIGNHDLRQMGRLRSGSVISAVRLT